MGKIIGIDLGTTNSVVAVMEGDTPKVLINSAGNRTTPSVVGFTDKGERLVGQQAKHQQVTNPENTVFSIKRFMGRRHKEVSRRRSWCRTRSSAAPTRISCRSRCATRSTRPRRSARWSCELKKTAEDYLGEEVTEAVITVPAYFNDSQRQATKEAGEIAGLKVKRIINEPTAAAWPTGSTRRRTRPSRSSTSAAGRSTSRSSTSATKGLRRGARTNGDTHLGGDDWTSA